MKYNERPPLLYWKYSTDGTIETNCPKEVIDKPQPKHYDYVKMTLPERECKRCGAKWTPRKNKPPVQCPKCKSPYWNRPKKI
jgi:hypothetical protein